MKTYDPNSAWGSSAGTAVRDEAPAKPTVAELREEFAKNQAASAEESFKKARTEFNASMAELTKGSKEAPEATAPEADKGEELDPKFSVESVIDEVATEKPAATEEQDTAETTGEPTSDETELDVPRGTEPEAPRRHVFRSPEAERKDATEYIERTESGAKLEKVDSELETIASRIEELNAEKTEIEKTIATRESEISELDKVIAPASEEISTLTGEIQEKKKNLFNIISNGLIAAVKDAFSSDPTSDKFGEFLEDIKSEHSTKQDKVTELHQKQEALKEPLAERDTKQQELDEARVKAAEINAELAKLAVDQIKHQQAHDILETEDATEREATVENYTREAILDEIGGEDNVESYRNGLALEESQAEDKYSSDMARLERLSSDLPLLARLGVNVSSEFDQKLADEKAAIEKARKDALDDIKRRSDTFNTYFPKATKAEKVKGLLGSLSIKSALDKFKRRRLISQIVL